MATKGLMDSLRGRTLTDNQDPAPGPVLAADRNGSECADDIRKCTARDNNVQHVNARPRVHNNAGPASAPVRFHVIGLHEVVVRQGDAHVTIVTLYDFNLAFC